MLFHKKNQKVRAKSLACLSLASNGLHYAIGYKHQQEWEIQAVGSCLSIDHRQDLHILKKVSRSAKHRNILMLPSSAYQIIRIHVESPSQHLLVEAVVEATGFSAGEFIFDKIKPVQSESDEWILAVMTCHALDEVLQTLKPWHIPCHQLVVQELGVAGLQPYLPTGDILFLIATGSPVCYRGAYYHGGGLQATFDLPDEAEATIPERVGILLELFQEYQLPADEKKNLCLAVVTDSDSLSNQLMTEIASSQVEVQAINCLTLETLPQHFLTNASANSTLCVSGLGYYAAAFT